MPSHLYRYAARLHNPLPTLRSNSLKSLRGSDEFDPTCIAKNACPSLCHLSSYNNRYGERVENIEDWVMEACLLLAKLNGGATRLSPAQGMWFNGTDDRLICETTHIVYSCVKAPTFFQNLGVIRSFIARFGRETEQDSVAVEFDGIIYFLSDDALAEPAHDREIEHA